jgi:hypothetical protein
VEKILSILDKRNALFFKNYQELKKWMLNTYGELIDSNFLWACDYCLQSKAAVLSDISFNKGSYTPNLAYFDSTFSCCNCGVEWVFTTSEKKAWYETYKLPINSKPDLCLNCRRKKWLRKDQNTYLSELLGKDIATLTDSEVADIIAIYTDWAKADKVSYFQSVLVKRTSNRPHNSS